jgi:hypothetical protein
MWKYWSSYMTLCIEKGLNFGTMSRFSTIMLQLARHGQAVSGPKNQLINKHPPYFPHLAPK